ncbi:hypothetical protein R6K78_11400, partial [Enterococcus faecium]|nr:hypothetical protein [Enterococcus faecium]
IVIPPAIFFYYSTLFDSRFKTLQQNHFNQVNQGFISSVASKRNHIPRKSLNYQTPLEVFLSYVNGKFCLA